MRLILSLRVASVASLLTVAFFCIALSAAAGHKKKPPTKPVDLNTATVEQLEQLPGIGPATAQAIVRFREKSGPFQRVDDLLAVRRISKSRLEKLRPYVTVGTPGRKPAAERPPSTRAERP